MKHTLRIVAASLLALGLASCGGGGGSKNSNPTGVTSVRVFGDSIADSGTFGIKFTVNNAGPGGSATPIWTELVANTLGLPSVCPFFSIAGTSVATAPACKSYAVGGGRINNLTNKDAPPSNTNPWSIPHQMELAFSTFAAAGAAAAFPANELILVDGGGNDSADVIGAFIGAGDIRNPSGIRDYMALLGTMLDSTTINSLIAVPATAADPVSGAAKLGGLYMVAVADKMADAVKTKLLARGATKVAIINAPAVTNTPRFKSVLKAITAASGESTANGVQAFSRAWTQAFNDRLKVLLGADARVVIVDLFTDFDNQVNLPAQFGLTNPISSITGVIDTACLITGQDASMLPKYDFVTCTAANLDAIPAKKSVWRTQSFSDGFHPTPYGHVLASQLVNKTLASKGWM
jgi:outer membrane lipase/esterase